MAAIPDILRQWLAARRRIVAALLAALVLFSCTQGDYGKPPSASGTSLSPSPSRNPPPTKPRLRLLGHNNLGGGGFNADVWAFKGFAYVGIWGGPRTGIACPASGVKVVSLAKPRKPKFVSVLQNPAGTTAEDVVVIHVDGDSFTGDLAAVGIQPCASERQGSVFRGLQFFDVTRPRRPRELGRWQASTTTMGCHEIDLAATAAGRVLAGCASPFAASAGTDEVVIVDAGDPRAPVKVGGYTAPIGNSAGAGCYQYSYAHNVFFANSARHMYVSYWDAGTMLLDISRPRRPSVVTTIPRRRRGDGDNHSVGVGDEVLLINHEDFSPSTHRYFGACTGGFPGWGQMDVYDNKRPAHPRLRAVFGTKRSRRDRAPGGGEFTVHNTDVVFGDQVFASWFADGIRWIDVSNPKRPVEKAHFVPRAAVDPNGFFPKVANVWGVKHMEGSDIIVASDMNGGLWVLKAIGLRQPDQ